MQLLRLLVEVFQDILHVVGDALRCHQRLVGIDTPDLLALDGSLCLNSLYVVHLERQHILVTDGIDDGVLVKLVTKSLFRGAQLRVLTGSCVFGKDRCTSESEYHVLLEGLRDSRVHQAKLGAMALIKNHHDILVCTLDFLAVLDQGSKLLNSGDDDFRRLGCVIELFLKFTGISVAVGTTFLEVIILLHSLIVQILAVNHKQNLIYV